MNFETNHPGPQKKTRLHSATTLEELGIEKPQSHRWQTQAEIPVAQFDHYIETQKSAQAEITSADLIRMGAKIKRQRQKCSGRPAAAASVNDARYTIHHGDALSVLRTLPDESVHTCVTSPPYWGLRDYGTAKWVDGDTECDHSIVNDTQATAGICVKCGARRVDNQIGLEDDPNDYVATLTAIFREVRRVIRADGTCWLNIGDNYNAQTGSGYPGTGQANLKWRRWSPHSPIDKESFFAARSPFVALSKRDTHVV